MYSVGLFQQSSNAMKTVTTLRIPNRNVTIYILKSNFININSAVLNLRTDKIIVEFVACICERDKTFSVSSLPFAFEHLSKFLL